MKYYTVKEVAEILEKSEEQVRRYIRRNELAATMCSKKEGYYISQDAIDLFYMTHYLGKSTYRENTGLLTLKKNLVKKIDYYQKMVELIDAVVEINTKNLRKGD